MTFTIVIDNDLHFSILELAAILDLELKTEEHQHKTTFQNLLDENNTDEIVNKLIEIQPFFITEFSKKSFEPSINLYLHIVKLVNNDTLLTSLLSNIEANIESTSIPSDVLLIALTNIFNSLPTTSSIRLQALQSIVKLIVKEKISSVISNIAKNTENWIVSITEDISNENVNELVTSIFDQYSSENELDSIKFVESLIINNKVLLNSRTLINYFSKILSSSSIYNLTNTQTSFKSIENESFVKLLNLYLTGDYNAFTSNKSEFETSSFSSSINFENLESTFQSVSILNYLAKSNLSSIQYSNISNDLNIPIEDVELKLIALISEGLIIGKLNQKLNAITVNSINYSLSSSLSLNEELINWAEISSLLSSWNENINNLQSTLQNLISKRGKRVNAPAVIMKFHQQKLEAKEAREKKAAQADQTDGSEPIANETVDA